MICSTVHVPSAFSATSQSHEQQRKKQKTTETPSGTLSIVAKLGLGWVGLGCIVLGWLFWVGLDWVVLGYVVLCCVVWGWTGLGWVDGDTCW